MRLFFSKIPPIFIKFHLFGWNFRKKGELQRNRWNFEKKRVSFNIGSTILRLSNYEKRKRKNCRIFFGNMICENEIHIFSFFHPRKTKNEKNPRSKLRFFKSGFDFEIPTLLRNCRNFNSNSHKFYEKPWVKKNSRNLKVVIPLSQTL